MPIDSANIFPHPLRIGAGYKRVDVASSVPNLNISAFTNAAQTKVTVIVINNTASTAKLKLDVTGKTISNITVDQSKETELYKRLEDVEAAKEISFPPKTISTVALDI